MKKASSSDCGKEQMLSSGCNTEANRPLGTHNPSPLQARVLYFCTLVYCISCCSHFCISSGLIITLVLWLRRDCFFYFIKQFNVLFCKADYPPLPKYFLTKDGLDGSDIRYTYIVHSVVCHSENLTSSPLDLHLENLLKRLVIKLCSRILFDKIPTLKGSGLFLRTQALSKIQLSN